VLSGEATNTNFIVFGLTRPALEPAIYRTRDEHTNHYQARIQAGAHPTRAPLKKKKKKVAWLDWQSL